MMRARRVFGTLAAVAALTGLGACDSAPRSAAGAPVDIQLIHAAGVVMQVRSVVSAGERTLVNIHVLNGRDREIKLNAGTEHGFILTGSGEKLMLVDAPTNPDLAIPPGKAMDGALVFAGTLPDSGRATLVLNDNGSRDGTATSRPRFEAVIPLEGTRSSHAVPEASALSNMANLPVSDIGRAQAQGGAFGPAGAPASNLQAVEKLKTELGAVETERGTVVSLSGDVTFDFDKATLRTEGRETLDRLAELIAAGEDGKIRIEGHTDAKGDDAYNKRLSEQRAEAVKAYLAEKGVAADRMTTVGLGELRPIAPNAKPDGSDDEESRQRNRRVEIILPKAGAQPATQPSPD